MRVKDLEIISNDLLRKKPPDLFKEKDVLMSLEKIPQKPQDLFIEPYKEFYIAANFSGEGWIVVLNSKAKDILDLVDNRHSVRELYDLFLKSSLNKLTNQDILLFWKGEISLRDIFNKILFNRPLVRIDDFLTFLMLMKKVKLIYFLEDKEEERPPERKLDVWIHLTNQCNLRCPYCYVAKTPRRMGQEKAVLIIDRIFESAKKNELKQITLRFAGGEPLMEFPVMRKLTEYIYRKYQDILEKGIKLTIIVLTNATLIDEEFIKWVKDNKIKVAVSLDSLGGSDNRQEASIQEEKALTRVKKVIELLKGRKIDFSVITVVSKSNLADLPALAGWLIKHQIPFTFTFIRKNPLINRGLMPKNDELIEAVSKSLDLVAQNIPSFSGYRRLCNGVPRRYDSFYDGGCGIGRIFAAVDEKGDIYPCHMTFSQKHMKIASVVGDCNMDIYSLINSRRVRAFNPGVKEKSDCKDCRWRYICSSPCPMSNFFEAGKTTSRSYYCETYKVLIPQVLKLEAERLLCIRK